VNGRYSLRFCILAHRTRAEDIERTIDWLADAPIDEVASGSGVGRENRSG
jgi:hypothetical protein